MFRRMGELLIEFGDLSADDLQRIMAEQSRAYRPFGQIAAELFGISPEAIRQAWAVQYARYCPRVELSSEWRSDEVVQYVCASDAWTYRLFPLRWHDGDLVLVTLPDRLATSFRIVDERLDISTVIWLCDSRQVLEDAIRQAYPGADRLEPGRGVDSGQTHLLSAKQAH